MGTTVTVSFYLSNLFLDENKDEVVSETIDICEIKDSKFASSFRTILQNFLDMPLRSLEGLDEI